MDTSERNKKGLLFLAGIAAGVTAGYWLNSDKGRKWRKSRTEELNNFGSNVSERASESIDQMKENLSTVVDKAKEGIHTAAGKGKEVMEKVEKNFEKGADTAKKKIEKRAKELKPTNN